MTEKQQELAKVLLADPAVDSLSSFIGADGTNTTLNSGRIQINLKPLDERKISATEVINREILHRLHEKLDAFDLFEFGLQAADNVGGGDFALVERLEIDLDAPAVEGGVGAIDADERGEALDRRILQDDLGQLLLHRGHGREGNGLRRPREMP